MRCSIPVGMSIKANGELKYLRCGKDALMKCEDSDWYICDDHKEYVDTKGWKLNLIKEGDNDENQTGGREQFCYVEQRER
jgi:hypothetical protein